VSSPPWALTLGPPERSAAPLLPSAAARLLAFVALGAFGAVHWGRMAQPADATPGLLVLLAALPVALGLLAARHVRSAASRALAVAGACFALLVVALLAAGIPVNLLAPRAWPELVTGLLQGVGDMPSVRIPYRGLDEWTRAVLLLGGGLLVALAAVLAFAPRRDAAGQLGRPFAAAVALATLYATPAVQLESATPWLTGAVFSLLLAAFLTAERLRRDSASVAAAAVGLALVAGLVLAPRVDREDPLLDPTDLAQDLSRRSTSRFDWSHRYGPLDWPRDGREVLRVRAGREAYWKAANLTVFDGLRWTRGQAFGSQLDQLGTLRREWRLPMQVTVRALTTSDFIAAGSALSAPRRSPRIAVASGAGTYRTPRRPLQRGNTYQVDAYVPRPATRERAAAPPADVPGAEDYLRIALPSSAGGPRAGVPPAVGPPATTLVTFPVWGTGATPTANLPDGRAVADAGEILERSGYSRTWALAQRLRRRAPTPDAYVRAVQAYLARPEFAYSEQPAPSRVPLDAFLFDDRRGYCQHYSGAMALLLRMGGVPARVATGFSPGSRDDARGEFIVRDTDAHSWVEAWYPRLGWATFDPTPGEAPAAAQTTDRDVDGSAATGGGDEEEGSERALGRPGLGGFSGEEAQEGGTPRALLIAGGAAFAALAAGAVLLWRRRVRALRRPGAAVAELERALARTGRAPAATTTLADLAVRFRGTEGEPYLQALVAERYGYADRPPTPAERAALRRQLAAGLGLRGRARAWWALPPGAPPPRPKDARR
jgi:transglutaminase-like putative cysteine protease